MTRTAFGAGMAVLLAVVPAAAGPSIWRLAREPNEVKAERLLVKVGRLRTQEMLVEQEYALRARQAAIMVELWAGVSRWPARGARYERLADTDLMFFYGDALIAAAWQRDREGRDVLRRALEREPDSALAPRAWFAVAIASNRLGDYAGARDAYGEALRHEWDIDQRARIHMNRAEESMALGDLKASRRDYLTALSLSEDSEVFALANWGLGVALARDNELLAGLERVFQAANMRFVVEGRPVAAIDLPTVFYTPDYEVLFYRALAEMAVSQRTQNPALTVQALERALERLDKYIREARAASDRWVAVAEDHASWCNRKLEAARKLKPPSKKPVPSEPEEID